MKKNIIILVAVVVGIAASAFFGGMQYTESKASARTGQRFGGGNGNPEGLRERFQGEEGAQGRGGFVRGGMEGEFVAGEILTKDAESMTVGLPQGGSRIIFISEKTAVSKSVEGELTELIPRRFVTINGTANDDGSVTATSIRIGAWETTETRNVQ